MVQENFKESRLKLQHLKYRRSRPCYSRLNTRRGRLINKYFVNIRTEKGMLKCGSRGSFEEYYRTFKFKVLKIIKIKMCYLKHEELGSFNIREIWWFQGLHTRYSNISEFKQDINQWITDWVDETNQIKEGKITKENTLTINLSYRNIFV